MLALNSQRQLVIVPATLPKSKLIDVSLISEYHKAFAALLGVAPSHMFTPDTKHLRAILSQIWSLDKIVKEVKRLEKLAAVQKIPFKQYSDYRDAASRLYVYLLDPKTVRHFEDVSISICLLAVDKFIEVFQAFQVRVPASSMRRFQTQFFNKTLTRESVARELVRLRRVPSYRFETLASDEAFANILKAITNCVASCRINNSDNVIIPVDISRHPRLE